MDHSAPVVTGGVVGEGVKVGRGVSVGVGEGGMGAFTIKGRKIGLVAWDTWSGTLPAS